jgi:hypothetical protein
MPLVGTTSTSADVRGIGFRNVHGVRNCPNSEGPESWLDRLDIAFLI